MPCMVNTLSSIISEFLGVACGPKSPRVSARTLTEGKRGILVGYNKANHRYYRVFDPETKRIFESVRITFDEGMFPAKAVQALQPPPVTEGEVIAFPGASDAEDSTIILDDTVKPDAMVPGLDDQVGAQETVGVLEPGKQAVDRQPAMGRGLRVKNPALNKKQTLCQLPGCVKGPMLHEVHHLHYQSANTHSPVVGWEVMRIVFAIVAIRDIEMHLTDVTQAFLQANVDERSSSAKQRGTCSLAPTMRRWDAFSTRLSRTQAGFP